MLKSAGDDWWQTHHHRGRPRRANHSGHHADRGERSPRPECHLLRQDPQALVIGEIRDDETAQIAVRAALTGHLVISTLHAGSCQGVFERLLVLCPDRSAIASAVELVLNQRLMRVLCRDCAGAGCAVCLHTGYKGRLPLVEWLRVNDALRARIRLRELQGMAPQRTLEEFARELLQRGLSNETEYRRVFGK
ncbi:MAG: hypothetical protein DME26_06600 [Verrucomicrobia bacterium]|nr:MAG: hypothetical protein DME26_06600 [Verrucomicrobiota bacterium]